ncbi:LOW QUALITY PROTEIN: coiled-coil domain-containing protein 136-like [Hippocampus comes]|uniref:LOW QUALITY PROTEIN: coiled-coil domain-containing protein 136-like n=1 Tax=Hippocampus comes TaxID=109280 RepID=UPI00094F1D96|nr:PREDICTED: LOW QUALITY PROTEIN: coiled-coil domain-containing protein 136-like [Hippocampus comes]
MDAARFPPLLEEASDAADDLSGLKADSGLAAERVAFEGKDHHHRRRREKVETERQPTGRDGDEQQLDELRAQVPQLLLELDRAREASGKHRRSFLELQGLLEDERLASAHQAEAFTRQIQNLQAQLRSARAEMDGLEEEEKAGELAEAREELRAAREEALLLQQAAEEAAAERENDIASLQEELCRRRAELRRLGDDAREYELEIAAPRGDIGVKSRRGKPGRRRVSTIRSHADAVTCRLPEAALSHPGDADPLKGECRTLREECRALKEDNRRLSERLQLLRRQRTSPSAYLAPKEEEAGTQGGQGTETPADEVVSDSYMTVGRADASVRKNGGGGEVVSLREQLKRAEEKARQVQRECDALKLELRELQELYDGSQRERRQLEEELGRCKAELEKLAGGDPSFIHPSEPPVLSIPLIGMIVIVGVVWCWLSDLASRRARGAS